VGDALWLPLPDESFDIVVSVASIKHWPDRRRGLEQIRRVSKRGGLAYVIEVEKNGSKQDVQRFVDRWRLVLPGTRPFLYGYFRLFVAGQGLREEEMATLFRDAGFSSVYVQKIPSEPFLIGLGIK
jgi:ubiquinone/menaquinone biosynthesis C-methylase UbiE